jgi:hypothetical protein
MTVPKGVVKRKLPVRAGEHPAIFTQTLGRQPAVTWSKSISIPAGAEPRPPDVMHQIKAPMLRLA